MQRILLSTLFFIPAFIAISQFNLEVNQVYGGNSLDEAIDIATNQDSTTLFFGARTFSTDIDIPGNNGGSDYWIMKRNLNGSLIWNKNFGGVGNDDISTVMPHTDGGVLAFGTTRSEHGDFGDLQGLAGGWLIRVNSLGVLTKGKTFGAEISENGIDAVRHSNGNITMILEASSPTLEGKTNNGILDVWVVQVDANFSIRWTALLGGSRQDSPTAIATDPAGNTYIAATTQSNLPGLDPNFGKKDVWVLKLDPLGAVLWQKNIGGAEDDIANDILFDTSGNVFVVAHSLSLDGDFDINHGFSDLWLIKMKADNGDLDFVKNYGGSGIDANGNIAGLSNDRLVISASSNSDSIDLSSNKGFNDVWVFTLDLNGNIQQEMNYGGSLNDLAGDLITIDSVVYLFNSTLSTDKNVPVNGTSQMDLWFFTLDGNPDRCSDQFVCEQDSTTSNELFPPATDVLICVAGCTAGLSIGPDFIQGSCNDLIYPTAYFKLTTDTTADLLTLSITSDEFNEPHIALLRSGNCTSFTQIACAEGSDGFVILQYIDVDPLATYIIAISDAAGNLGQFELCATSVDVEFCNEKDSLYVNSASLGSPLSGPFRPGELIQICYELQDWNKLDCNGFQGVIPTFGPGWDPDGFDIFGMPKIIDTMLIPVTTGFWDWYKIGDVHYNVTNPISGFEGGQGLPAGWFFTNTADVPPNNGPDQTPGDINDCLPTPDRWKVCFTLPVEDECETNLDISVSMRTFSDGEVGVETSLACAYDQEETLSIGMVCCKNPTVQDIPETSICSGDTILLFPRTNILPPVTYSWLADPDVGIEGATSGTNATRFYQILTNNTNSVLKVNYMLSASGPNCQADPIIFVVRVYPQPTSRITITGANIVCSGTPVTLNFESTGTPPFAIELTRDDQFFANVLSESTNLSIQIDPVFSGRFKVGKIRDAFCEGDGLGFVNVTVKPLGSAIIDTSLCEGDSIVVGGETFLEPGNFLVRLNDGAANNCDSVITLSLSFISSQTEIIDQELCNGDTLFVLGQPYTETTHTLIEYVGPSGCPDYIQLDLIVRDTLTDEFNQTICGGDTLEFEGILVFQTGSYSHVEELMSGCFAQTILNLTVLPEITINGLSIIGDHGNNDGAVLLELTGGSPPFTYLWSNGETTESIFNVMHGHYELTVMDRQGCTQVFGFDVPMGTAVDESESHKDIRIWPSLVSSHDQLYISNPNYVTTQLKEVTWWDSNGRSISSDKLIQNVSPSLFSIIIPHHATNGLYFLVLTSEGGHTSWHKVVLAH